MAEGCQQTRTLIHLPRQDVLFKHILPYLPLGDLFRLGVTCVAMHDSLHHYFQVMTTLDLMYIGPKFNKETLANIVKDSFMLRTISLTQAQKWLQTDDIIPIIKQNKQLVQINISSCICLTNGVLHCMSTYLPDLKQLKLGGCHWVSNQALVMLAEHCRSLQVLDISACWELEDATVTTLVKLCTKLNHLDVGGVYSVTDSSIAALAQSCPNLRLLKIHACWRVTDDGIRQLTEHCKKLRLLHVKDCRSVTEASLQRLRLRGVLIDIPNKHYQLGESYVKFLQTLKVQI